ncbi:MAG: hypothetical protein APF84_17515 [Gracilibacter sp. BRH_c7a]|nr:MAG: hypothetical protein APF84_17515 [Gracilibacter sp. BRH_c7a]
MLFLKLIGLELLLLYVAGLSFFAGIKGILISGIFVSILNFIFNYQNFWSWQLIIILMVMIGSLINYLLDKKTHELRIIKVTAGSIVSLFTAPIFFSIVPAFLIWIVIIGIPLGFTYRNITKFVYLQILFRFIFGFGWIIIGNVIY